MNQLEIEKKVKVLIENSKLGLEVESLKIDFKRKWYDLTDPFQISEFAKDTTAIVNTIGLDGYLIIGYDNLKNEFHSASFKDSQLKDASELVDILAKKCSEIFDLNCFDIVIDENKISVLHIPVYKNKPVLVKNFTKQKNGSTINNEQRIYVRKNAKNLYANKTDIEKMFYDRKNVEVEFDFYLDTMNVKMYQHKMMKVDTVSWDFYVENIGRRHLTIIKAYVIIQKDDREILKIYANKKMENGTTRTLNDFIFTATPSSSQRVELYFDEKPSNSIIIENNIDLIFVLIQINGKKIVEKVSILENNGLYEPF